MSAESESDVSPSVRRTAETLTEPGLLTDRQAVAYVLRNIEGKRRREAAELMGLDMSTVDYHYGEAKKKVESARETLEAIDSL